MEVAIIVDLLRRAKIEVILASLERAQHVTCSRGLRIAPDAALSDVCDTSETYDAVVLPGGAEGADRLAASPAVAEVLRRHVEAGRLIGAICAAPAALRAHGFGHGRRLTSHPSVRARVAPGADYQESSVVEDGLFVTSRGPGTAFDFALAIIRRLSGPEVRAQVLAPLMLEVVP